MMRMRSNPAMCAAAAPMKVLPRAHLADDRGAPVGLEGEGRAPDGVGLRPQGLAEQPGERAAVLRGPVERRVGRHHPLGDGVLEVVDELSEVHCVSPFLREHTESPKTPSSRRTSPTPRRRWREGAQGGSERREAPSLVLCGCRLSCSASDKLCEAPPGGGLPRYAALCEPSMRLSGPPCGRLVRPLPRRSSVR